jgi:SAM-dependent methyltransferase
VAQGQGPLARHPRSADPHALTGRRLDDPDLVRDEYADESRLAARQASWANATGPNARDVAFEAVAEVSPRTVLEVGSGRGELAERIAHELGAHVVAVDQSERMVELTRARGVEALVGDVQQLPFADASFDCALAAWMLFHVPDLDRGLAELARVLRPGGRLVAATNSERSLHELWELAGSRPYGHSTFSAENGEQSLLRHFAHVERRDVVGTTTFADREAARAYVAASVTRGELAERLPKFERPLVCTRHVAVFVAEKAA